MKGILAILSSTCLIASAQQTLVLDKPTFRVEYRHDLGIPQMVSWPLAKEHLGNIKRDPSFRFKVDGDTPRPRVTSDLYTRSGYQRGHMCPAADRSASRSSMKSTFIMSNVCPMTAALNCGSWKLTEELERKIARRFDSCRVISGALFFPSDTQWIGRGRVAVPHAFYKCIYTVDPPHVWGWFIYENK